MKTTVVYCSQTGHTKRYAEWLAEELGCEAIPYAERGMLDFGSIDVLVFCSWFHAASIKGTKWLKRMMAEHPKLQVAVLATGATPMPGTGWSTQEEIDEAFARSFPKEQYPDLPCFYCQGGYDYEKLGAADKIAMRMFYKMHEGKDDPKTREMLDTMRRGFDGTRREHLMPMLDFLRGIEAQHG